MMHIELTDAQVEEIKSSVNVNRVTKEEIVRVLEFLSDKASFFDYENRMAEYNGVCELYSDGTMRFVSWDYSETYDSIDDFVDTVNLRGN